MKMKTIPTILCTLILVALNMPARAADSDLAVIVNKANATSNMTKSQLRKLVLGEQASWPSGAKVVVVLLQPGTPERDGVLRSICRMSEDDYNQHQMHANFSGETNTAPKVVNSAALARQVVENTPGAIAFLRPADVKDSVKTISVEGASVGQPDYKIKAGK
jgi:ABC-type phosphate transport system substrate-binding protein